jgi:hypothetical protein
MYDYPFQTDGCTLYGWFHKAVYGTLPPFRSTLCLEHDRAYWEGGSFGDKLRADLTLLDGLLTAGRIKRAYAYHGLVVFFALLLLTPVLPVMPLRSWRWGGGWRFFRRRRWYLEEAY